MYGEPPAVKKISPTNWIAKPHWMNAIMDVSMRNIPMGRSQPSTICTESAWSRNLAAVRRHDAGYWPVRKNKEQKGRRKLQ